MATRLLETANGLSSGSAALFAGGHHDAAESGSVTDLVCTNPDSVPVTQLDGIENLVNLERIDLSHNAINDIACWTGCLAFERLI